MTVALAVALAVAALPLATRERRGTPLARKIWSLMLVALSAAFLARVVSLISPVWETRYLASILAALLLLGAVACARSGILGLLALVLTLAFAANAASFAPQYKSDMRDVAGELAPYLRPGDVVLLAQPDQSALASYYLPAGLRFATTMGPVTDPSYMNWVDAYGRLSAARAGAPTFAALAQQPASRPAAALRATADRRGGGLVAVLGHLGPPPRGPVGGAHHRQPEAPAARRHGGPAQLPWRVLRGRQRLGLHQAALSEPTRAAAEVALCAWSHIHSRQRRGARERTTGRTTRRMRTLLPPRRPAGGEGRRI